MAGVPGGPGVPDVRAVGGESAGRAEQEGEAGVPVGEVIGG